MIFAYAFWYLLGSFGRRALLGCQMHFHRVSELQEFRHSFSREGSLRSQGIHPRIQGDHVDPRWMDEKPAHSIPMCNVVANTSKLAHSLRPQVTPDGSVLSHKLRCHPAFWPDRIESADKLEARGRGREKSRFHRIH
ncbi:hypothetical protein V8E55_009157 [Tylopilus felleus]